MGCPLRWRLMALVVVGAALSWMVACQPGGRAVPTLMPTPTVMATAAPVIMDTATPMATATQVPVATATRIATLIPATSIPATATLMPTLAMTPTAAPTEASSGPIVRIGRTAYRVELALTRGERAQGLSGRLALEPDAAMLFVYDDDGAQTFWMPNMRFPLDMVWIKSDCTVRGVTADVPNPPADVPLGDLPRYPSTEPVRFVLEINAGQAERHGIVAGGRVEFAGEIAGRWGC